MALPHSQHQPCPPNHQITLPDPLLKQAQALDGLDTPAPWEYLHELWSIYGTKTTLATSYILPLLLPTVGSLPLASGVYGDVYEGRLDGSKVCVKRIRAYNQEIQQKVTKTFCRGAAGWKNLSHPNIVPLLGITTTPFQLVSNWMPGGDLPEYIGKHPDADRPQLLTDVAKGLYYLHSRDVTHGDLKGVRCCSKSTFTTVLT
jgi:hypothetical protein